MEVFDITDETHKTENQKTEHVSVKDTDDDNATENQL